MDGNLIHFIIWLLVGMISILLSFYNNIGEITLVDLSLALLFSFLGPIALILLIMEFNKEIIHWLLIWSKRIF